MIREPCHIRLLHDRWFGRTMAFATQRWSSSLYSARLTAKRIGKMKMRPNSVQSAAGVTKTNWVCRMFLWAR
jgi:hypothetical protein